MALSILELEWEWRISNMENKDFKKVEPTTENINIDAPVEVKQEDFSFIDSNTIQHETKFETKPTTFLKDSLKDLERINHRLSQRLF